jgi:hypothetical protein
MFRLIVNFIGMTTMVCCIACVAYPQERACEINIAPVLANGDSVSAQVLSVKLIEDSGTLHGTNDPVDFRSEQRSKQSGIRLVLSRKYQFRKLELMLESDKAKKEFQSTNRQVFVVCGGSYSLLVAENFSTEDSCCTTIRGIVEYRGLTHKKSDSFWIRIVPMFGGSFYPSWTEAVVSANGEFEVVGMLSGSRHIIILGSNTSVLAVQQIDIKREGLNNVGVVHFR